GVRVHRAEDKACRGFEAAATAKRAIAIGPCGKASVEPVARRQNGSGRPIGFPGLADSFLDFSGDNGARAITAHYDPASRIASVAPGGKRIARLKLFAQRST